MQAIPLGRNSLAQTAVVSLLTLAALVMLGAVLAYWTWAWFAPRPEPRAEVVPAETGSIAAASLVFGKVERNRDVAAPTSIAIKLLGVVAASRGRRGYAVVQLEGKQILAVHEGDDVAAGVRLAEVHPDHAILERGGAREMLAWPTKPGGAVTPAAAAAQSAAAQVGVVNVPKPAEPAAAKAAEAPPRPAEPVAAPVQVEQARGRRRRESESN